MPGSGSDCASASTASRSARVSRRHGVDAQVCLGSPPRPDDLAGDEHGSRPDTRGPQLGGGTHTVFAGLANYRDVLGDSDLWSGVLRMLALGAVTVPATVLFALLFALLLDPDAGPARAASPGSRSSCRTPCPACRLPAVGLPLPARRQPVPLRARQARAAAAGPAGRRPLYFSRWPTSRSGAASAST